MSPELIAIIIVGLSNAASLAFLWALHRDVAGLSERVARLEERFEQFEKRFVRLEERFEQFEKRFVRLEERFEQFERRMARLEGWLEKLAGRAPGTGEGETGT